MQEILFLHTEKTLSSSSRHKQHYAKKEYQVQESETRFQSVRADFNCINSNEKPAKRGNYSKELLSYLCDK